MVNFAPQRYPIVQKLSNDELGRPSLNDYKEQEKLPFVLVLDNVRSALNVGSIFRTADAFAANAIYLCGITAIPPNKDILKTALGATESVVWKYFETTQLALDSLKNNGYCLVAIEQVTTSILLQDFQLNDRPIALILGHEMDGVDQDIINLCDHCIEIPQQGIKHSINVAVCAGIICWEFYQKYEKRRIANG